MAIYTSKPKTLSTHVIMKVMRPVRKNVNQGEKSQEKILQINFKNERNVQIYEITKPTQLFVCFALSFAGQAFKRLTEFCLRSGYLPISTLQHLLRGQ